MARGPCTGVHFARGLPWGVLRCARGPSAERHHATLGSSGKGNRVQPVFFFPRVGGRGSMCPRVAAPATIPERYGLRPRRDLYGRIHARHR